MITAKEKTDLHQVYWRIRQLLFMPELTAGETEECLIDAIRILQRLAAARSLKP